MTRTIFVVWNPARTEGFATVDRQLAYEARKGAESNCCDAEGNRSELAVTFCNLYSSDQDCSTEEFTAPGAIDYRDLLRRYIAHVRACEGAVPLVDPASDVVFTDAERAELERLEAEGRAT